jgi:hypothetical protein
MRFEGAPPELSDSEDEVMGTWGIIWKTVRLVFFFLGT